MQDANTTSDRDADRLHSIAAAVVLIAYYRIAAARLKERTAVLQAELDDSPEGRVLAKLRATAGQYGTAARHTKHVLTDLALEHFAATGTKDPHPAVKVIQRTALHYTETGALALAIRLGWATCLSLRKRAFEAAARRAIDARAKLLAIAGDFGPQTRGQLLGLTDFTEANLHSYTDIRLARDLSAHEPADGYSAPPVTSADDAREVLRKVPAWLADAWAEGAAAAAEKVVAQGQEATGAEPNDLANHIVEILTGHNPMTDQQVEAEAESIFQEAVASARAAGHDIPEKPV